MHTTAQKILCSGWLSPDAEWHPVGISHAIFILQNPELFGELRSVTKKDLINSLDALAPQLYELAYNKKWLRVVGPQGFFGNPTMYVEGPEITSAQRKFLEDEFYERNKKLKIVQEYQGKRGRTLFGQRSDEIQLGDQMLRVVELRTAKEQSAGFQHFDEIPRDYGYLFPGAGGNHFHMYNVGAPLLLIALRNGKVVGKEVRQPNTPGKPVCGGKGRDVLELHPLYDPWIEVGKMIGGEDEKRTAELKQEVDIPTELKWIAEEQDALHEQSLVKTTPALEKDYNALECISQVLHNHAKAKQDSALGRDAIFLYDADEHGIIAAIQVVLKGETAEVTWLGSREPGHGAPLMQKALVQAAERGATTVKVDAKYESTGFYAKQGLTAGEVALNPMSGFDLTRFTGPIRKGQSIEDQVDDLRMLPAGDCRHDVQVAPIQHEEEIRTAYEKVRVDTGFPAVSIAVLMKAAGIPLSPEAKGELVALAKEGRADLYGMDWSLADENERAWAVIFRGEVCLAIQFPEQRAAQVRDNTIYNAPGNAIDVSTDFELPAGWNLIQDGALWIIRNAAGKIVSATASRAGTIQQALATLRTAQIRPYGAWIDRSGNITAVGPFQHQKVAKKKFGAKGKDETEIYDWMTRSGFTRVSTSFEGQYYAEGLQYTPPQLRALKTWAEDNHALVTDARRDLFDFRREAFGGLKFHSNGARTDAKLLQRPLVC